MPRAVQGHYLPTFQPRMANEQHIRDVLYIDDYKQHTILHALLSHRSKIRWVSELPCRSRSSLTTPAPFSCSFSAPSNCTTARSPEQRVPCSWASWLDGSVETLTLGATRRPSRRRWTSTLRRPLNSEPEAQAKRANNVRDPRPHAAVDKSSFVFGAYLSGLVQRANEEHVHQAQPCTQMSLVREDQSHRPSSRK